MFTRVIGLSLGILINPIRLGEAFREPNVPASSLLLTAPVILLLFLWSGFSATGPVRDWLLMELAGVLVITSLYALAYHINARILNPQSGVAFVSTLALVFFILSALSLYLYLPLSLLGRMITRPVLLVNYRTILWITTGILFITVSVISLARLHTISVAKSIFAAAMVMGYVIFFIYSCYFLENLMK